MQERDASVKRCMTIFAVRARKTLWRSDASAGAAGGEPREWQGALQLSIGGDGLMRFDPDDRRSRCGAMPWLAATREVLNDDMRPPQHGHGFGSTRGCRIWRCSRLVRRHPGRHSEQLAARDVRRAVAIGERPIVTDAMHALGQHMHQEAPDELVS